MLDKIMVLFLLGLLTACAGSSGKKSDSEEQASVQFELGVRYLEMGMLKEAEDKLQQAEQLDSNNVDVQDALAVLNERLEQPDEAEYHYRKALELNPASISTLNNYGRFLCNAGQYQQGFKLLEQALSMPLNNRKWIAQTNIGLCYLKQGEKKLAEQAFRRALQDNPQYAPALAEMQKISYDDRNYLSARAFLQRYLAVGRHTPQTLWIAWQTERALGNREQAETYRGQLLTLFPGSDEAQKARKAISR